MNIRFPALKKQFENLIGYAAYRLLVALFWLLPWQCIYGFSKIIYFVICHLLKIRHTHITSTLSKSFPEKSREEIQTIVKEHYRYLSEFFVECIKSHSLSSKALLKHCHISNPEILEPYYEKGTSVIGILGHFQNWELGIACSQQTRHDISFIFKPFHNPYFNDYLLKQRTKHGASLISKYAFVKTIYKQRNNPTFYFLLADQKSKGNDKCVTIDFLNRPTRCLAAPGILAKKLNLPVVYIGIERVKRGYYKATLSPLPDPAEEGVTADAITEAGMRALEAQIRKNPAYWLWVHRRWDS